MNKFMSRFLQTILFLSCTFFSLAQNPIIAHRGAWKKEGLPQNSLASLRQAIKLGCAGSEFDIRITQDDSLVIVHYATHEGLFIESTPYAELMKHPLKNGEKIPTLREYLVEGLRDNPSTRLILEIKPTSPDRQRGLLVADQCVALVHTLKAQKNVAYISFDYAIVLQVKKQDSQALVYYLEGNRSPDELKADGVTGMNYHFSVFQKKPEWVVQAQKEGVQVLSWTVNNPEIIQTFVAQSFNFITTDEPEMGLNIWKERR